MGMDPNQPPYGQQPSYGSPPPPPPYGAPVPPTGSAGSKWGPTSMGMEAHIAAGLSYIPIVGIIFFFIEKSNRFVRFNAAQSILLTIAWFVIVVISIVLAVISGTLTASDNGGLATAGLLFSCIFTCIPFLLYLGILGLTIWGFIAGFMGKYVKMPIIGGIAESWAGGPIPA